MKVFNLEPGINLIDLDPPIPGFDGIFGTYVIQSDKTALLDVGPTSSLPNLFSGLAELNINPEEVDYILCSHIHLDHSGGLGGAMQRMPKAVGIVHPKGHGHLVDPARLWAGSLNVLGDLAIAYGEPEPVPEKRLLTAAEDMLIDLGGIKLRVVLTPGHASHHISFFEQRTGRLFVGEAAGVNLSSLGGLRPATPNPFDLRQSINSANKMIALDPKTILYAHFGRFDDAILQLNLFKHQLIVWGKIIARHIHDNMEWQEIFQEINKQDKSLAQIHSLSEERKECLFNFIKNNIIGYREYLKKEGIDVLKELEET
jgi:glyoxylase-like metal-dependent hydrolase (beta-lactamase superfamily II)